MSEELKKLKAALASKFTPESSKAKLQARINAIEAKESEAKKAAEPKESAKKKSNKGGSAAGAKAGAERMALAGEIHKKEKKNGMTWPQAMKAASNQLKGIVEKPKPKAKKIVRKAKEAPKPKAKKIVRKSKVVAKKSPKKIVRLRGSSDKAIDKSIKAKKPGKRLSRAGNTYYETRRNRADNDLRKKL